ncbi:MAG: lytic transglycosylase domain-containing protein [Myxococcota bacterium]
MKRLVPFVIGFALCGGLSCAVRPLPDREAVLPPVPAEAASASSDAIDEVEALFARHLTGLAPFEVRRAAEALIAESKRHRIDPALVLAVMHTESGYYNFARSSVGALGLMQIMPATGEMLAREAGIAWTGPDLLFEPEVNLRLGTRYLSLLYARYGDWNQALAAYNWGPGAIDKRLAEGESLPVQYTNRIYARLARQ